MAGVFNIASGQDFLNVFAKALSAGQILAGLDDPLNLSRVKIFLPTQRAVNALILELRRAYRIEALLLPRLLPLGALDEHSIFDWSATLATESFIAAQPIPAITPLARRMRLMRMIFAWAKALPNAIVGIDAERGILHDESEPLLVADTPESAWRLAADLAQLIDEIHIEGIDSKRLGDLSGDFDDYWRITTEFLTIAFRQWPLYLAAIKKIDPAERNIRLIKSHIAALSLSTDPVIAIGSTGSNRATAELLNSIAKLPNGALVLAGLDQDLDEESFNSIIVNQTQSGPQNASHPQAMLARLLTVLGVKRCEVKKLGYASSDIRTRMHFVNQAMRPAETTDHWFEWQKSNHQGALKAVSLIEAEDEREEALAIALAMRHALEDPEQSIALITPHRALSLRVSIELQRWNIESDDSGGQPLILFQEGALAVLLLDFLAQNGNALDLMAILNHAQVQLGLTATQVQRCAPLIEIAFLRQILPPPDWLNIMLWVDAAKAQGTNDFAHQSLRAIQPWQWQEMSQTLVKLAEALKPLTELSVQKQPMPLKLWLQAHRRSLDELKDGAVSSNVHAEAALQGLFDDLLLACEPHPGFSARNYREFFAELCRELIVRGTNRAHPRLKILGTLEARLLHADLVILAGLDEHIWPPQPKSDPFLNRPMRQSLGLSSPERRIGQSAHDFVQALGNPKVILTRAKKRDSAPTVTSRFLLRLQTLAGSEWQNCKKSGQIYLDLARVIDRPATIAPCIRPAPAPPVELRPVHLSVTRIETLRRDPYAIYAQHILRLQRLDPIGIVHGARERGIAIHKILADFCAAYPCGPLPENAHQLLIQFARDTLAQFLDNPSFYALQWPRIVESLSYYLNFESERRSEFLRLASEQDGRLTLSLSDGSNFQLTARADRIEELKNGAILLADYKTGSPPTLKMIRSGFSPQLTLEAAMVRQGAFNQFPAGGALAGAVYVKLGGIEGGKQIEISAEDLQSLSHQHFVELRRLLEQLRLPQTGFISRPYPQYRNASSDYDHLARVKEWGGAEDMP